MQRQHNELELLIAEAFRKGSPAYLAPVLSLIYNKVDVRHCFLQKIDIEKLNRLSYKADSTATYYIIGLTYDLILSSKVVDVEAIPSDVLMAMANSLLPVLDNIKGTSLSYRIIQYIQILFYVILERKDIPEEDHNLIEGLLQGENLKFGKIFFNFEENEDVQEILKLSKSKNAEDKISAVSKLLELMTQCISFEEQIEIFAKKTLEIIKFVVNGTNETNMDLFGVLGSFLEKMLFQFQYNVLFEKRLFEPEASFEKIPSAFIALSGDQSNKKLGVNEVLESINKEFSPRSTPKIVVQYLLAEQMRIVRETEGIYTLAVFILNIFINYPKHIDLQLVSLRVAERLYYHFPAHRKQLEELIMIALARISTETSEDVKKQAAVFLYKLIHRDASQSFKAELEKREAIKGLFSSIHYNSAALVAERNAADMTDFQDLQIFAGSPLSRTIDAGTVRSEYIEVWQPYSILSFNFGVVQYDLTFSVERIARFKNLLRHEKDVPTTIIKNGKVEFSKGPVRGNILIKEPGLYRLDFDNKSSWFHSKTVRFRIFVLSPNYEESLALKNNIGLIYDTALGETLLPSTIYASDSQGSLNSSRERIGTNSSRDRISPNSSMIMSQKGQESVKALIYLSDKAVEFSMVSYDKEFEIILNYDSEGPIDWEKINLRILNVIEKVFDSSAERQSDRKIDMQLVYDESVLEKQLKLERLDDKFPESVEEYFFKNLSLLVKIKNLLKGGKIQIITEMEFQVQRLLYTGPNAKPMILLIIDHETKGIYCKFRKDTQALDVNLDDYVIPISKVPEENAEEETVELKPAEVLFFGEGQSDRKRLGYLAFIIHSIFCSTTWAVRDYTIIEDVPLLFGSKSSNRDVLREMIESFYNKFKRAEGQENAGEYSLNIQFCDENKGSNVKISDK